MVRIDYLIFGYRKYIVAIQDLSIVSSIFVRERIGAKLNSDGTFIAKERDTKRICALLNDKVEYKISETLGIYGTYKRAEFKKSILISSVISTIILMLASSLIWDIRVEGNVNIPDSKVKQELAECGFNVGSFWQTVDRGRVENELLLHSEDIGWVNINRRGSVAYVTVAEKSPTVREENTSGIYSNIVASTDCVIEEISVNKGIAVVEVGDVVQRGDVLISGVLPHGSGGVCNAAGRVIGRVSDTVSVEVERNYEKKSKKTEELYSITLSFFNFSINIFKRYGNLPDDCVIIENIKNMSLFGKRKLPFSVTTETLISYESREGIYSDSEIVNIAAKRLSSITNAKLASSDLLRIRTRGKYTDNGYVISSDVVFCTEVGENLEFIYE